MRKESAEQILIKKTSALRAGSAARKEEKYMTIKEILELAKENDASDIHMAPGSPIMFRTNGRLVPKDEEILRPTEIDKLIHEIMTKEQLALLKEEGEQNFAYAIPGFCRTRVNIFSQRGIYAVSLRILSYDVPTPESLGIPKSVVALTEKRRGLILVTGTAGSGKSTTLASLIDVIAKRDYKNIITLEDPIEYLYSNKKSIVSQREIGYDIKNYVEGIHAALRQDPDVIMVGEMSDMDTIGAALAAAETGHLVFATLHTSNTVDAVARIVDVFPPYQQQQIRVQLASVLRGIVAQQLLPRSDVRGRVGVFEVLLGSPMIRDLIREDKIHQIQGVITKNKKEGMQSMDDAIMDAYMRSQISVETAIAYAYDPDAMSEKVQIF